MSEKGFSLVEVFVVVLVFSIIAITLFITNESEPEIEALIPPTPSIAITEPANNVQVISEPTLEPTITTVATPTSTTTQQFNFDITLEAYNQTASYSFETTSQNMSSFTSSVTPSNNRVKSTIGTISNGITSLNVYFFGEIFLAGHIVSYTDFLDTKDFGQVRRVTTEDNVTYYTTSPITFEDTCNYVAYNSTFDPPCGQFYVSGEESTMHHFNYSLVIKCETTEGNIGYAYCDKLVQNLIITNKTTN